MKVTRQFLIDAIQKGGRHFNDAINEILTAHTCDIEKVRAMGDKRAEELKLELQKPKQITEHDLLCGNCRLEVWKVGDDICVNYAGTETKDDSMHRSDFGRGNTFNEALNDYYQQIRGQTLVFNATQNNRKEVRVI